jgi:N-acetylglutamate synthase-like GNAT family acetyltransferase
MLRENLIIEPLAAPTTLAALAADARADGRRMVDRLIEEWNDGRNRFDRPGERAYVATREGRVSGVCGLNRDPFADDPRVGRVRRLYVAVADRRQGVGSAIMARLMSDARGAFGLIHLRTHDAQAAAFYEALGFERVVGAPECTHRRPVVA